MTHWNVLRIHRTTSNNKNPFPVVQTLRPWRILLEESGGRQELCDVLEEYHFNGNKPPRFAIPSERECIVFIIGPKNISGKAVNLRVMWDNPQDLLLITSDQSGRSYILESNVSDTPGWIQAKVPCTHTKKSFEAYSGPWHTIEVHTVINELGLKTRIEHHASYRVPDGKFWLKKKSNASGGYGNMNRNILAKQSQAAIGWMFALREIVRHTRLDEYLAQHKAYIKLMGFETNNPLHDDYAGEGAHFHFAVRKTKIEVTPHIYMDHNGGCRYHPNHCC